MTGARNRPGAGVVSARLLPPNGDFHSLASSAPHPRGGHRGARNLAVN